MPAADRRRAAPSAPQRSPPRGVWRASQEKDLKRALPVRERHPFRTDSGGISGGTINAPIAIFNRTKVPHATIILGEDQRNRCAGHTLTEIHDRRAGHALFADFIHPDCRVLGCVKRYMGTPP